MSVEFYVHNLKENYEVSTQNSHVLLPPVHQLTFCNTCYFTFIDFILYTIYLFNSITDLLYYCSFCCIIFHVCHLFHYSVVFSFPEPFGNEPWTSGFFPPKYFSICVVTLVREGSVGIIPYSLMQSIFKLASFLNNGLRNNFPVWSHVGI